MVLETRIELMTISEGMSLFKNLCMGPLRFEADSYNSLKWAQGSSNPPSRLTLILKELKKMAESLNVSFHHISIESDEAESLAMGQ